MSDTEANEWQRGLAGAYTPRSRDFVRYRDEPADESVRAIIQSVLLGGPDVREGFRRSQRHRTDDVIQLYAERRVIQARRRASHALLDDVVDAFALLDVDEVPWDSWLKGALVVARFIGRDLVSLRERFEDLATANASARFAIAYDSMNRVTSIDECHLVEVTTDYGTSLLETLVFHDKSPLIRSLYGAGPRLGDHVVAYHPETNLAMLAARLADALDATRTTVTGPIGHDQLAATSFAQSVPGSYVPTTGCLSFVAEGDAGASMSVFVAELPPEADFAVLAAGAESLEDQAVFLDPPRLVLAITQPRFDDVDSPPVDFEEVGDVVRQVFIDSSALPWQPH